MHLTWHTLQRYTVLSAVVVAALFSLTAHAHAYYTNMPASVVLGQPDFVSNTSTVSSKDFDQVLSTASDGKHLFVTNGHRVLIYNTLPTQNYAPADVVVGQPDFTSNIANNGGISDRTLNCSCYVATDGTHLAVVDSGNHRVLIWNSIPTTNFQPADVVVGQPDFVTTSSAVTSSKYSTQVLAVAFYENKLFVADYPGRVLIYNSIPTINGTAADVVVGKPDFNSSVSGTTASLFANNASVRSIAVSNGKLFVADSTNQRVLVFNSIPTTNGVPADVVVGQPDFTSKITNNGGVSACSLNGPSGVVTLSGNRLLIGDAGDNNRALIFNHIPETNFTCADIVLGQPSFSVVGASGVINASSFNSLNAQPMRAGVEINNQIILPDQTNRRVLIFSNQLPDVSLSRTITGQPNGILRFQGTATTNIPNGIVKHVEYSINGSSWNGGSPTDGHFDSATENYYFDFDPKSNASSNQQGFTVKVRSTHNNDIDTSSSALYFEPFVTNSPEDHSHLSTGLPTFTFSISKDRFRDLKDGLDRFRVMVKKDGQEWQPYADYIPVDYESVRMTGDNLQKSVVVTTGNGTYEDKSKTVTYTNDNATLAVTAKPSDSLGNVSDKFRENGGTILSPGTYEWRVEAVDRVGNIQQTDTRTLYIGGTSSIFSGVYFPLTLLTVTGLGNHIISTDYPQGILSDYTTWSQTPTFYGLAWVNAIVRLNLTEQSCKTDCTKSFTTIVNPASRFGINIPSGALHYGRKYAVQLSTTYQNFYNELPTFTVQVRNL